MTLRRTLHHNNKLADPFQTTSLLVGVLLLAVLAACSPSSLKPAVSDDGLWFARSKRDVDRKYFAHYFGPYPRSIDNKWPDYYDREYLKASGEGGRHASYGGLLRDRPLERPPLSGDFRLQDAIWEIKAAQKMGIDGFLVDILSFKGLSYAIYTRLVDAAVQLDSGFKIVPMIDSNGEAAATATPQEWALRLGFFMNKKSSYYTRDGRYLITSFYADKHPANWWTKRLKAAQSVNGEAVAFDAGLLDASKVTEYTQIADFVGPWSYGADPARIKEASPEALLMARSAGIKWMGSAVSQNVRPSQGTFDEAANSEALRASWVRIIHDKADLVEAVTWNDFSEGSQLTPSVARSWAPAAIAAYYAEEWKTGASPIILRDELILSHRAQLLASPSFTSGQRSLMKQKTVGVFTPTRNRVEALTYLTAPATVTVTVGAARYTYAAPAGEFVETFPIVLGTVSGSVVRRGAVVAAVTSPFPVVAKPVSQDIQYFFVSSLHGTDGQHAVMAP